MSAESVEGRSPLAIAAFRKYLAARWLASVSVQMLSVAVGVQVYAATGRTRDLAWVGLVQFVPMLVFVLPAGRVADATDGRSIALVCDVGFALCAALLLASTYVSAGALWVVFSALFVLGFSRAFYGPAVQSLLPRIVGTSLLSRAVATQSGAWQVAAVSGPALAGALYFGGSPRVVYAVALVGTLIALALMAWLRLDRSVAERVVSESKAPSRWYEGLSYVWRNDLLLAVLSLDFLAVFLGGATALIPVMVKDVLHRGESTVGLLRAAPSIGAALVALWLARNPIRSSAGIKLVGSVVLFGAFTVLFGVSRTVWLSFAALLGLGAVDTVSVVLRATLVQKGSPTALRGRVAAVNQLFMSASNELGEVESGLLAEWVSAATAIVIGGVGAMVVAVATGARFRALRELESVESVRPEPHG
ncbi:MAG: MFS transporter [Polyangiales bacterium]